MTKSIEPLDAPQIIHLAYEQGWINEKQRAYGWGMGQHGLCTDYGNKLAAELLVSHAEEYMLWRTKQRLGVE